MFGNILRSLRPWYNPPKGYRTINRLNRSQRWKKAKSYADARVKSPYPDRAVR